MTLPDDDTMGTYGGPYNDAYPVEDPTTDLGAGSFNPLAGSTAAATHTAARAYVVITGNATTPTVLEHNSNWGNSNPVIPTLVRNGTGDITATWPTTVTAEDGTTRTLNFKRAFGAWIEGNNWAIFNLTVTSGNVVRIRTAAVTLGSPANIVASDLVGLNFGFWVR
jgi:hypothetical protein